MKLMTTLDEKKCYFDRVKLSNYRESMRLEGYSPALDTIPDSKEEREKLKQAIIDRYLKRER